MKSLLHRLVRLDGLIRVKNTGSPGQLAKSIGISERSVYDYLRVMKEMGAPIQFSRKAQTYHYEQNGHFNVKFLQFGKEQS